MRIDYTNRPVGGSLPRSLTPVILLALAIILAFRPQTAAQAALLREDDPTTPISSISVPRSSLSDAQITYRAYLPLVSNGPAAPQEPGIYGRITYRGAPVAGIHLLLRRYNGTFWSSVAEAVTAGDGRYRFVDVPSLRSGQAYYVRYSNSADGNSDNSNYLWLWAGPPLTQFESGDSLPGGSCDIADVRLQAPPARITMPLPATFQWAPRSTSPSDSYEFNLMDPGDGDPYWWSEKLGYEGNYTLTALPEGFASGTSYGWEVWVYDPQGGAGQSYHYRMVTFSNAGGAADWSEAERRSTVPQRDPVEDARGTRDGIAKERKSE